MYRITLALLLAPTSLVDEVIDFETADLVAAPRGWTISMTHEGGAPCWEIARDPTSPGGVKVLAQLSDDRTSGRFPLAIYDSASLANGEIGVKFKPISGRVDQAAGLVWRYADENNYYIVRANALENNVVLYKVENGRRSSLSPVGRSGDYGVKHTVPSQQWSTLGVVFSDSTAATRWHRLIREAPATVPCTRNLYQACSPLTTCRHALRRSNDRSRVRARRRLARGTVPGQLYKIARRCGTTRPSKSRCPCLSPLQSRNARPCSVTLQYSLQKVCT